MQSAKQKNITTSRWYRLLPVVFVTYSLAYLDRANFGFGTAAGMATDLRITPAESSLLASLFFLGYFFFQFPGVYYASKNSAKKLIFWCLLLWGLCAMATGVLTNIRMLMVTRFLLGVVESAVFPSMLLLLSRWFTRAERSRANTFLILGNPVTILWMSVLSGYLANSVGWRWMFVLEGLPAIVWAAFWWRLVQDGPASSTWLPATEKQALQLTLQHEQQSITPVKNYGAALKSPTVILLCVQYFLWSLGVYGFVIWLPSVIRATAGMGLVKTGWLSAAPYLLAVAAMAAVSWLCDKTMQRKLFVWPCLLVGSVAFFFAYFAGSGNFWLSFMLLCVAGMAMYAPYGPFFAFITDILPANVVAGAIAVVNSFGALGSFAGSYLVGWLNGTTRGYGASYLLMGCSLLAAAIITAIVKQGGKYPLAKPKL